MARTLLSLLLLAAAASGPVACIQDNGRPPPLNLLYFPTAAAIAPGDGHGGAAGQWLYVVNSDFDLRYNGGTVVMLNLQKIRQDAQGVVDCGHPYELPFMQGPPPGDAGTACGADAGVLQPASQCTGRCCPDLVAPYTYECDVALYLDPAHPGRKINPFALEAAIARYTTDRTYLRLYVLVRGDGSISWFDLGDSNGVEQGQLNCGTLAADGSCSDDHRAGFDPTFSASGNDVLPSAPSSLSLDPAMGWITVVHQSTEANVPRASIFRDLAAVPAAMRPPAPGQSGGVPHPLLLNLVPNLVAGLDALTLVTPGDPVTGARSTWLAVSRNDPSFTVLQAYAGNVRLNDATTFLYQNSTAPLPGLNTGANNRAVALDPRPVTAAAPRRAFVVSRSPEALLSVDISNLGAPVVTDVIPVAPGPSRLLPVWTPPTATAPGHTLVYVVSYDARKIWVVNPAAHRVVHQIPTNRGPHQLLQDPDPAHPFLYLVDFLDSTVEVIYIGDPDPTLHRRVLTVGVPNPPQANR